MIDNLTAEQTTKLDSLLKAGINEKEKVRTINEGLNDSIKALAEELDVKPKIIRRALNVAYKQQYAEFTEENDAVNSILESTGRTI